jgi:uncharacterized protein (TIGR03437 family)
MTFGGAPARRPQVIPLGLGPTRGTVPFGTAFPQSPALVVAPVDVVANGLPAEILYTGGYPGSTDAYQINLRLPAGLAPGTAELKIHSAWIEGSSVLIPIGRCAHSWGRKLVEPRTPHPTSLVSRPWEVGA